MHVFYIIPSLNILRIIDIKFNPSLAGLQTKGKFACPVCGPKMKSRRSRSLGKEVFDEYRHFLSKNHRYRSTEKHIFNGKEETGLKPQRMTPRLWKLQYNRNRQGMDQIVYVSYMKCLEYFIFLLHFVHCTN
jgi:hypothetical protein